MKKLLLILITLVLFTSIAYSQELEKPMAGSTKVYVFNFAGSLIRTPVALFLDQKYIGKIDGSNVFGLDLAPGEYILWARNLNLNWFIKLNVAADKTYYVHLQPAPDNPFNPIDAPILHNACPNHRKGKKRYKMIQKRLKKGSFTIQSGNTAETIAQGNSEKKVDIAEAWTEWQNELSGNRKWQQINPEDGE